MLLIIAMFQDSSENIIIIIKQELIECGWWAVASSYQRMSRYECYDSCIIITKNYYEVILYMIYRY